MLEARKVNYGESLESALIKLESLLKGDYWIGKRAIGLFLLQGDHEIEKLVKEQEGERFVSIQKVIDQTRSGFSQPLSYVITQRRQEAAKQVLLCVIRRREEFRESFAEWLSRAMMNPVTGIPILLIILFALYEFVGVFGAQTVVGFLENTIFAEKLNPWLTGIVTALIPWKVISDLFVGEYGIITLGLTYAIAIIFPIVGTFFLFFSLIEDVGYLPRLCMLIDRLFKVIGLSGRAVIPMVLGFGCDTMATIATRVLETKRERVLATLLLALAIPCSAQLGVILALLSGNPVGLMIWGGVVFLILLLVGYLASKVIPGKRAVFYMEIPPLRRPQITNVLTKTYARMQWFFFEVLPLFIIASILLWIGELTGLLGLIVSGLEPIIVLIGLPPESAFAFLYGFFRRDFGAAGLYTLHSAGALSGVQLVVAVVILTLFMPCIAQTIITIRERGAKTALLIILFIFPFAFFVGFILNQILTALGVSL